MSINTFFTIIRGSTNAGLWHTGTPNCLPLLLKFCVAALSDPRNFLCDFRRIFFRDLGSTKNRVLYTSIWAVREVVPGPVSFSPGFSITRPRSFQELTYSIQPQITSIKRALIHFSQLSEVRRMLVYGIPAPPYVFHCYSNFAWPLNLSRGTF